MRWIAAIALLVIGSGAAFALDCPPGAYPWVGRNGVEYCKRDVVGPAASAGRAESCPRGTRPSTDRWGASSCKPADSRNR